MRVETLLFLLTTSLLGPSSSFTGIPTAFKRPQQFQSSASSDHGGTSSALHSIDINSLIVAVSDVVGEAGTDVAVVSLSAGVVASRVALTAGFVGAAVKFGNFAKTLETADDRLLTVMQANAPLVVDKNEEMAAGVPATKIKVETEVAKEEEEVKVEAAVAVVDEKVKMEEKKKEEKAKAPAAVVTAPAPAPVAAPSPAPVPAAPKKEDISAKVDAAAKKALADKAAAEIAAAEKSLVIAQQRKDDLLAAKELAAKTALKKESEAVLEKLKKKEAELDEVQVATFPVDKDLKKKGLLKKKRVVVPLLVGAVVGVLKFTGKVVFF
ncbi:hypothetical protein TrST_g8520 [Triparma strigata]|uniref:Uncharacterized protein n=1 Tax=Triparma strigata TaxID=1606541 RepID=A0A9W7BJH1_9STRA|nr:hypothetical protein TrST_g8520 [Triparma strigata]